NGDLAITGARRVKVSGLQGGINLAATNGTVELREVTGPVRVEAPFSKIKAEGLAAAAEIKTRHGSVEVTRAAGLSIDALNSPVRAENVTGDLTVQSSREPVRLRVVQGEVIVTGAGIPVTAEEVRGAVRVDTSNAPVSIKNFYGGVG